MSFTLSSRSTTSTTKNMKKVIPTRGVTLLVVMLGWAVQVSYGYGTYEFDIHHRYSEQVKRVLDIENGSSSKLIEKGSVEYVVALAQNDKAIHGPLTFSSGNTTNRISLFGFLQYANVTVGTPGMWFLVALDTGSDLFWLPCDCDSCVKGIKTTSQELDFNIYSPSTSSTGTKVPCNSSLCAQKSSCSESPSTCAYRIKYLSANTSTSGYLIEDLLHLVANDDSSKPVHAKVPFGCGKDQTGSFLDGGAPNGLLGLGLNNISVPSILASKKIAANSFSMCFGNDGTGRIAFGDQGSSDQCETPFSLKQLSPRYNISIEQIIVGNNISSIDVHAIFDSGTSFTYLDEPAYTLIAENFDSLVTDNRYISDPDIPFEYCYDLSPIQGISDTPPINLTMKGGDQLYVTDPTVTISTETGDAIYCLGIVKSEGLNIIGQNFMTGYHVVFDREKMVLGWKASNCYDALDSNAPPISPQSSAEVPPKASMEPRAVPGNNSHDSRASSTSILSHFNLWACTLIFGFLQVLSNLS